MKNLILMCFLFGIISCGTKSNEKKEQTSSIVKTVYQKTGRLDSFSNYLDAIPKIEIPTKYSCNNSFDRINLESKYRPEGSSIMGKLNSINENHFIIYTYPADNTLPILEIYNNEGLKLNQLILLDMAHCSFEAEDEHSRFIVPNDSFIILENFKVNKSDTIVVKSRTIELKKLLIK